jgi:hypothetical protein
MILPILLEILIVGTASQLTKDSDRLSILLQASATGYHLVSTPSHDDGVTALALGLNYLSLPMRVCQLHVLALLRLRPS